jgi:DNA-binding NarL/FixJ family response regulator
METLLKQVEDAFTSREKEILAALCEGLCDKEIAGKLFVSMQTVKYHLSSLYRKTNCHSRLLLAVWAFRNGFVR